MGAWVDPDLHATYAHGNVLMWHTAVNSPMYSNTSAPAYAYWKSRFDRLLLPDNIGASWIASSTCDQVVELVEGAWAIYTKGRNRTYAAKVPHWRFMMLPARRVVIFRRHAACLCQPTPFE